MDATQENEAGNIYSKLTRDIDSFSVVARHLVDLNPGICFDIYPKHVHSDKVMNKKILDQLKKKEPLLKKWDIHNTKQFKLGGDGFNKIYVLTHKDNLLAKNKKLGFRGFFMAAIQKVLVKMKSTSSTYLLNSKYTRYTESSLIKIVKTDWKDFCKELEEQIHEENGNTDNRFFYYKCCHDLKAEFDGDGKAELLQQLALAIQQHNANDTDNENQTINLGTTKSSSILFYQIHFGINFFAEPSSAILVDRRKMDESNIWKGDHVEFHAKCDKFFGTFSGVKIYQGCDYITYFHSYILNNHIYLGDREKSIFTEILQGCDKLLETDKLYAPGKIANIQKFFETLSECFVLRFEGVYTERSSGGLDQIIRSIATKMENFTEKLLKDLFEHELIAVIRHKSFRKYMAEFALFKAFRSELEQLERPLDKKRLLRIKNIEVEFDRVYLSPYNHHVKDEKAIDFRTRITIEDLCSFSCPQPFIREYLVHYYNHIMPLHSKLDHDSLYPLIFKSKIQRKFHMMLKIYASFSINLSLGLGYSLVQSEPEYHLNQEFINANKEQDTRWAVSVDYNQLGEAILHPTHPLSRLIFNHFFTENELTNPIHDPRENLLYCIKILRISAFPAIFFEDLSSGNVTSFNEWCPVVQHREEILNRPPHYRVSNMNRPLRVDNNIRNAKSTTPSSSVNNMDNESDYDLEKSTRNSFASLTIENEVESLHANDSHMTDATIKLTNPKESSPNNRVKGDKVMKSSKNIPSCPSSTNVMSSINAETIETPSVVSNTNSPLPLYENLSSFNSESNTASCSTTRTSKVSKKTAAAENDIQVVMFEEDDDDQLLSKNAQNPQCQSSGSNGNSTLRNYGSVKSFISNTVSTSNTQTSVLTNDEGKSNLKQQTSLFRTNIKNKKKKDDIVRVKLSEGARVPPSDVSSTKSSLPLYGDLSSFNSKLDTASSCTTHTSRVMEKSSTTNDAPIELITLDEDEDDPILSQNPLQFLNNIEGNLPPDAIDHSSPLSISIENSSIRNYESLETFISSTASTSTARSPISKYNGEISNLKPQSSFARTAHEKKKRNSQIPGPKSSKKGDTLRTPLQAITPCFGSREKIPSIIVQTKETSSIVSNTATSLPSYNDLSSFNSISNSITSQVIGGSSASNAVSSYQKTDNSKRKISQITKSHVLEQVHHTRTISEDSLLLIKHKDKRFKGLDVNYTPGTSNPSILSSTNSLLKNSSVLTNANSSRHSLPCTEPQPLKNNEQRTAAVGQSSLKGDTGKRKGKKRMNFSI